MRTIVDLPADQLSALAKLCSKQKISRAEAVRRAVSSLLESERVQREEFGFGLWRHKHLDARKIVEKLRREWHE